MERGGSARCRGREAELPIRTTRTLAQGNHPMRNVMGLLAATALGVTLALGVGAVAQSTKPGCANAPDLSRLYKRFDDLEQAIAALQAQSTTAPRTTLWRTRTTNGNWRTSAVRSPGSIR